MGGAGLAPIIYLKSKVSSITWAHLHSHHLNEGPEHEEKTQLLRTAQATGGSQVCPSSTGKGLAQRKEVQ